MVGATIEACGIGYHTGGEAWLWRHVDLCLPSGQVVGVLGRNGSGKTTLLRTLLGLLTPLEGHVRTAVVPGYVPQSTQLALPFTVWDVVAMGRARHVRLFGSLTPMDLEAVERALAHVGLTALAERSFFSLSGGERQLVLIARALASGCEALLLDEPFAALDLDNQCRTLRSLRTLARDQHLGILFSTHNPDHVFAIADTVLVLRRGEAPIYGPVAQVLTAAFLSQLYGVPVEVVELSHATHTGRHAIPLL